MPRSIEAETVKLVKSVEEELDFRGIEVRFQTRETDLSLLDYV